MRKQPYPILDLTGGINLEKDPFFLIDKQSPNLINLRLSKGLLRKDVAWEGNEFGSNIPLDGVPMFSDTLYTYDGGEYPLVCTTKWIYNYDASYNRFIIKNPIASTTASLTLTYNATAQTITRSTGDFTTDFSEGDVITTSNQIGHFTVTDVTALVLTVAEDYITNQGPVSGTVSILTPLTGTEDNNFTDCVTLDAGGDDVIFLTNGVDAILRWEGSGFFTFVTGVVAKCLGTFANRLILGNTLEGGVSCVKRIRFSVPGDPDDLTGTGSGFFDIIETSDWITYLCPFKDKFVIFKDRSVWELVYVGGTTYLTYRLLLDGVGTSAPGSVIPLGEEIIFFGNDNVYLYDMVSLKSIADGLLQLLYNTETKIVNGAYINRIVSVYVEELEDYWIAIPTTGSALTLLLKYNFTFDMWVKKNVQKAVTMFGFYSENDRPDWSELVGDWSAQTWNWLTRNLPAFAPTTLIGTSDGYIYEDDRLTRDNSYMCFETKDFAFAHAQRWVEFIMVVKGGDFYASFSTDSGVTWTGSVLFNSNADAFRTFKLPINFTSELVRCRIESTALDLTIKWIEPWYIPRQKSHQIYFRA
jgi:hypothetical protein